MANLNQPFKCLCMITTLFFLFLFSYTASSSPPLNQEIQPQNNPSSTTLAHHHQVFYLKNTDPDKFLSRQEYQRMIKKRNKNKKHRKKMVKNLKSRPFSVMLPKGFVPPSGSSPCHNDQPNSVSFFHCHLTTAEPEP